MPHIAFPPSRIWTTAQRSRFMRTIKDNGSEHYDNAEKHVRASRRYCWTRLSQRRVIFQITLMPVLLTRNLSWEGSDSVYSGSHASLTGSQYVRLLIRERGEAPRHLGRGQASWCLYHLEYMCAKFNYWEEAALVPISIINQRTDLT